MTYLSIAPEGLREALITGGLAPIGRPVDDVYSATYKRMADKNRAYFERYPDDRQRALEIFRRLDNEDVRLPGGDRLTARRFRQLGNWTGFSTGLEMLHHLLELPFGSNAFLYDAERGAAASRATRIYATLHESCYADGGVTNWSSARLLPAEFEQKGWFTAEHIFPWMFEDYGALRPHREAAGAAGAARMAAPLRPGRAGAQRGARRGDDLLRRPVCHCRFRAGNRGVDPWPAAVDNQRVRAQRHRG